MSQETERNSLAGTPVDRRTVLSGVSGIALGTTLYAGGAAAAPSGGSSGTTTDATPSRYTPIPDTSGAGATESLNGTWRFALAESDAPPATGTRVLTPDYSSTGAEATVAGDPPVYRDPSRRAFDLSGDSYVTVGTASDLDFTSGGFTVELTFRYAEDTVLFSKGNTQYSAGVYGGSLSFWTAAGGGWPSTGGGDLRAGEWYTATFAVGDGEIRVYVDGERVGSTSADLSTIPHAADPLAVGYNAGSDTQGDPVVDSLHVYDAALSDDEVAAGYDAPPASAVAWLPFDAASNGTTPDESGAGATGTLVNDPSFVSGAGGRGLDLSGDAYVSVPSSDALDFSTPGFSLRTRFTYGGGSGLVVNRGGGPVSRGTDQFALRIDGGTLSFDVASADGSALGPVSGDVTTGEWHTATAVAGGGRLRLYVDGSEVDSVAHDASAFADSDAPVVVGGDGLDLTVTSTAAFDTALSASNAASAFRGVPSSAVLWLTYDEVETRTVSWRDETVPGQWAYDGYRVPDGAADWYPPRGKLGWYRRSFEVPDDWRDGRLLLRFGAVYSEAHVYVNGTEATSHVGGYTPFEVDVTDLVERGGTNDLAVGVSQRSKSDDMAWRNVTGGITRDVTLVSVPETHLTGCTVRTSLDGHRAATVDVETAVTNAGSAATTDASVRVTLDDPNGRTVARADADVGALDAGETFGTTLSLDVHDPETWNPEQPRLYTATLELDADGTREEVSERVGIREVRVEGTDFLVNGESVTLRGIDWEEVYLPTVDAAISPGQTRADAKHLAEANVNYVRTSHFPVTAAFVEACDEYGIIVEEEAPHMFVGRDRGDPHPDVVVRQVEEMVERDRNRPSVCIWSLANESNWFDCFGTAAERARSLDPTRAIIFDHDKYVTNAPWHGVTDLHADHYPAFRAGSSVSDFAGIDGAPMFFNEYGHCYCYDDRELVTDPGLRDQWGRLFETVWEEIRGLDDVAGATLWAGGDHLEEWGQYFWGILDRNRRERPEFWHVRKTYAPVKFDDVTWHANGHRVSVTVENRNEFVSLEARPLTVSDGKRERTVAPDVPPGGKTRLTFPVTGDRFEITATHPNGHAVNELVATPEGRPAHGPANGGEHGHGKSHGRAHTPDANASSSTPASSVPLGPLSVSVDGTDVTVTNGDGTTLVSRVDVALTPAQSATGRDYETAIDHRPSGRTVTDVTSSGDTATITLSYDDAHGTITLDASGGALEASYDVTVDDAVAVREVGLAFTTPRGSTTLSWKRDGQWSVYPGDHVGRLSGTAEAFPDGTRPDHVGIDIGSGHPWKDDATAHGSNDFRSTKRTVETATLTDGDGAGVRVAAAGDQHVRASVRDDGVDFLVLDRSVSGTNADSWMDRHQVLDDDPALDAGTTLTGDATLGSVPPADGSDGTGRESGGNGSNADAPGRGSEPARDHRHHGERGR